MDEKSQSLTIGTLATLAGVHVETIRFYQRKGLLPEPDKPYGSIRRYTTSERRTGSVREVGVEARFQLG